YIVVDKLNELPVERVQQELVHLVPGVRLRSLALLTEEEPDILRQWLPGVVCGMPDIAVVKSLKVNFIHRSSKLPSGDPCVEGTLSEEMGPTDIHEDAIGTPISDHTPDLVASGGFVDILSRS